MRKIYKYELPVDGGIITIKQCIIKILSIQEQNGVPMMWAIVDPDNEKIESLEIIAIGTGWELPTGLEDYLGTAQDEYGFVWHYFTIKLNTLQNNIEDVKTAYKDLKEEAIAALAQSIGKMGVNVKQAAKAFDMRGLFDASM